MTEKKILNWKNIYVVYVKTFCLQSQLQDSLGLKPIENLCLPPSSKITQSALLLASSSSSSSSFPLSLTTGEARVLSAGLVSHRQDKKTHSSK